MKQTAVEWLLNEFQEAHKDFGGLDLQWLNKFEKAKEMEKQQQGYSEEEVYDILVKHTVELFKSEPQTLDEFFEKFKKK